MTGTDPPPPSIYLESKYLCFHGPRGRDIPYLSENKSVIYKNLKNKAVSPECGRGSVFMCFSEALVKEYLLWKGITPSFGKFYLVCVQWVRRDLAVEGG
jgi:hypothetical protein